MFTMLQLLYFFLLSVCGSPLLFSWSGYDYEKAEYIEIDKGNYVRKDEDIEVYHLGDGTYHLEEVQDFHGDELETYDYHTGEFHYYEMDQFLRR